MSQEFHIIDSTLREGEQFRNVRFTTSQKMHIAHLLSDIGVDYIEVTSPIVSSQYMEDTKKLLLLNLRSKIITHVRCNEEDIKMAAETGIDGVNILIFGTSPLLREFSHGRDIFQIIEECKKVLTQIRKKYPNLEIRISAEDSFRTPLNELIQVYQSLEQVGVNRLGIPDTTGIATPQEVSEVTRILKKIFNVPLEFHGHNDAGSSIANAYAFLQAGGDFIDTSILGIGERNGITPLSGFLARVYSVDKELVKKYNLKKLSKADKYIAKILKIKIPFNQPLTSINAFSHKAGIHTKAVFNNPKTYEIFNPADFGRKRIINYFSALTGKSAVRRRIQQLGFSVNKIEPKVLCKITKRIKEIASSKNITLREGDLIIKDILNGNK